MLLAVHGASDHPRVDAAVGYLRMHAAKATDLEHLAWAKIALSVHDSDTATRDLLPELDAKILAAAGDPETSVHRLGARPRCALARDEPAGAEEPTPPARSASGSGGVEPGAPSARNDAPNSSAARPSGRRAGAVGLRRPSGVEVPRADGRGPRQDEAAAGHVRGPHRPRAESTTRPLAEILAAQFEHFRAACPLAGKRVVLKPNLVEYRRGPVINTDPRVRRRGHHAVQAGRRGGSHRRGGAGALAERPVPGQRERPRRRCCEKHGVRFVDINHDEPVKVLNLGRLTGLDHLYMSRTVLTRRRVRSRCRS